MNFRLQHPEDLLTRMFMLEYLRNLDTKEVHDVCNEHQQKKMFYRFYDEQDNMQMDVNWEYMMFEATMYELESIMKKFLPQIEELDKKAKRENEILGDEVQKIMVPKTPALVDEKGNPL